MEILKSVAPLHSNHVIAQAAGLHPSQLSDILRGVKVPSDATLAKLRFAVRRLCNKQKLPTSPVDAAFSAVASLVARELGLDPTALRTAGPGVVSRGLAADARRMAMYLMNTRLGFHQAEVARACGVTRQAISLACAAVEESRDDATRDALLTRVEGWLLDAQ